MAIANWTVLDNFLKAYTGAIDSGFGAIDGTVHSLLGMMATISIALAAIFWVLDETENVISPLIRQVLKLGFFAWVVNDWQGLTETVVEGFTWIGLKAGGSGISPKTFLNNPSNIVVLGFKHAINQFNLIHAATGPIEFFDNFAAIVVLAITGLGIIIAFFVIAIQLVVTLIEFRLVTLAAFALIPFGVVKHTSFLAERSFGYVASVGLKLLTISIVVSIGGKTFDTLSFVKLGDDDLVIMQSFSLLLAALMIMALSLTIPAVASSLVTGGPQLGAGAALAGAAGLAAGAAGSYLAARGAAAGMGAAARGLANPTAGARQLAGGVASRARDAASKTMQKGFSHVEGGGSSSSSGASAAQSAANTVARAQRAGGAAGWSSGGASPSAPTEAMKDFAKKVAKEKGIDPPNLDSGKDVRSFLDQHSGSQLGPWRGGSGEVGSQEMAASNAADHSWEADSWETESWEIDQANTYGERGQAKAEHSPTIRSEAIAPTVSSPDAASVHSQPRGASAVQAGAPESKSSSTQNSKNAEAGSHQTSSQSGSPATDISGEAPASAAQTATSNLRSASAAHSVEASSPSAPGGEVAASEAGSAPAIVAAAPIAVPGALAASEATVARAAARSAAKGKTAKRTGQTAAQAASSQGGAGISALGNHENEE